LHALGQPNSPLEGLLVYVPAAKSLTDEAKQRDPFSLYAACGAVFPDGDGDEYLNLCLKAKPDHAPEIRRIFDGDPNPPFAVIDAVGAGAGWPTLQATLHVESARDILFALLAPSDAQARALRGRDAWLAEAKTLCQASLGLTPLTRGRSWDLLAAELWRFLLWSELAFDLPGELPASLAEIPRAPAAARPLVEDLCDRLRNDQRTVAAYLSRAEEVEQVLDLPARCRDLAGLGERATFPFQERASFGAAVRALEGGDLDAVRAALARHAGSVWAGRGESQAQWQVLEAAAGLIQACEDRGRHLPDHKGSLDALLDYSRGSLHAVDRAQREFEAAAGDLLDPAGELVAVANQARRAYRRLADQVQGLTLRHLARSGWPPAGRLANADLFDRLVAPKLQESGRRVALLLLDALRYELGLALHGHLWARATPGPRCSRPSPNCPRRRRWVWPACCRAPASPCACCAATTSSRRPWATRRSAASSSVWRCCGRATASASPRPRCAISCVPPSSCRRRPSCWCCAVTRWTATSRATPRPRPACSAAPSSRCARPWASWPSWASTTR
jgi:hypothetical protein